MCLMGMEGKEMFDIFGMIKNGGRYFAHGKFGEEFDDYIAEGKDEYYILVDHLVLADQYSIGKLFKRYFISEIYDLANCYMGLANTRYMYWHLTNKKVAKIKTAVFYDYAHPYRDTVEDKLRIPDRYNDNYKKYIALLEKWAESDSLPADLEHVWEFNEIDEREFDYSKPYAGYYRKSYEDLRRLLYTEKIVPLREIADVIHVVAKDRGNDTTRVKALGGDKTPTYPYIPELQASEHFISTEKLHKGDVVRFKRGNNEYFLIDKESQSDLYATMGSTILRARSICPEYLYLYLNSSIARRIRRFFHVPLDDYSSTILCGSEEDFPVIVPKEKESVYKDRFLKISSPDKRFYDAIEQLKEPKSIEQILDLEWRKKIRINENEKLRNLIEEDVLELNTCYDNKAYKSTIILAGSIMEALLIDWLSEIRGVDYFSNSLRKRDYDKDNKCYKKDVDGNYIYLEDKRADLSDYIDEIRDIKKPQWDEEAEKAHKIRTKRNLIHAKLCLNKNVLINNETCKEIVDCLKSIIESRWR